jgi:hypothetical protein
MRCEEYHFRGGGGHCLCVWKVVADALPLLNHTTRTSHASLAADKERGGVSKLISLSPIKLKRKRMRTLL